MAENSPRVPAPTDFLNAWKQMAEQAEGQWNQYFNQMMGTEQFAELMGRSMERYLAQQQALGDSVDRALRAMNLPTRADFAALGERVAALETQLSLLTAEKQRAARQPSGEVNASGRRRGAKASRE
jgi:polyhydroxyalkanoic acid synthase PhaR subunit